MPAQVVKDVFFDFTAEREGFTPFMYCDRLNLVTTGVGNLIDRSKRDSFDISANAMTPAMSLPWKFKAPGWTSKNPLAAERANADEIREAWIRTKLQEQNFPGFNEGGGFKYAGLTPLTLDLTAIHNLFNTTLADFDAKLLKVSRFPNYGAWPADAQLALLSMAWAMGPAFTDPDAEHPKGKFIQFRNAANLEDFVTASRESFFNGGGGTLNARAGRNRENELMFKNAADVVKGGVDRGRLFFPGTVTSSPGVLPVANISGASPGSMAVTAVASSAAGYGLWRLYKHFTGKKSR